MGPHLCLCPQSSAHNAHAEPEHELRMLTSNSSWDAIQGDVVGLHLEEDRPQEDQPSDAGHEKVDACGGRGLDHVITSQGPGTWSCVVVYQAAKPAGCRLVVVAQAGAHGRRCRPRCLCRRLTPRHGAQLEGEGVANDDHVCDSAGASSGR